jgi:hypothetical protein
MNMPKVPLEMKDRVMVVMGGKMVKGRVAEVMGANAVRVTFAKGDEGKIFERTEVVALYRYVEQEVDTPLGKGILQGFIPLIVQETDTKV